MYRKKYWGGHTPKSEPNIEEQIAVTEAVEEVALSPEPQQPKADEEILNKNQSTAKESEQKNTSTAVNPNSKSKIVAGILGILLGYLGIHNFYLGYTGKGIAQLLISTVGLCFTCGLSIFISLIWGFIEGILILSGSINKDANGIPLSE